MFEALERNHSNHLVSSLTSKHDSFAFAVMRSYLKQYVTKHKQSAFLKNKILMAIIIIIIIIIIVKACGSSMNN